MLGESEKEREREREREKRERREREERGRETASSFFVKQLKMVVTLGSQIV